MGQSNTGFGKEVGGSGTVGVSQVGDIASDQSLARLFSVEMEVDKGLLSPAVSSIGTAELVENQSGPKVGKWKRWARDGAKTKAAAQGGMKLGKRIQEVQVLGSDKKQKVVSNVEILSSDINESSAGRSQPACRSQ